MFYFLWNWSLKWKWRCVGFLMARDRMWWRLTRLEDSDSLGWLSLTYCRSYLILGLGFCLRSSVRHDLPSSGVDHLNTVLFLRSTQLPSVLHHMKKAKNSNLQWSIPSTWGCSSLCCDGGWAESKSSLLLGCGLLSVAHRPNDLLLMHIPLVQSSLHGYASLPGVSVLKYPISF